MVQHLQLKYSMRSREEPDLRWLGLDSLPCSRQLLNYHYDPSFFTVAVHGIFLFYTATTVTMWRHLTKKEAYILQNEIVSTIARGYQWYLVRQKRWLNPKGYLAKGFLNSKVFGLLENLAWFRGDRASLPRLTQLILSLLFTNSECF